jgi:EAL domain-containing protein (putative c-di-GMP-specific phosphodiesterase class I)/GGDEF domain-containing protein
MKSQALENDGMRQFKDVTSTILERYQIGCLMLLNVKNFQQINHQHGYKFGGHVLSDINKRLTNVIADTGYAIHYSADQFFLFIHQSCDKEFAAELYRKIDDALDEPFSKGKIHCELSFRLASINYDGDGSFDDLFQSLEYSMKILRMTDESFAFAHSVPPAVFRSDDAFRKAFFGSKLNGNLCFYLQPKIRLDNNDLVGAEALLRWYDNVNGVFYPVDAVLESLERFKMMDELAIYSVDYVLSVLQSGINCPISLNLGLTQLSSKRVINHYLKVAAEYPSLTDKIEIEVTEDSLFIQHSNSMLHLQKLCAANFAMAIDDFGKGCSNLQRIIEIKPKTVKIDKLFTDSVIECQVTRNVIKALVMMTSSQQTMLVAEGIESQEQVRCLKKLGVTIGQGFHLGRPMPKDEFIRLCQLCIAS